MKNVTPNQFGTLPQSLPSTPSLPSTQGSNPDWNREKSGMQQGFWHAYAANPSQASSESASSMTQPYNVWNSSKTPYNILLAAFVPVPLDSSDSASTTLGVVLASEKDKGYDSYVEALAIQNDRLNVNNGPIVGPVDMDHMDVGENYTLATTISGKHMTLVDLFRRKVIAKSTGVNHALLFDAHHPKLQAHVLAFASNGAWTLWSINDKAQLNNVFTAVVPPVPGQLNHAVVQHACRWPVDARDLIPGFNNETLLHAEQVVLAGFSNGTLQFHYIVLHGSPNVPRVRPAGVSMEISQVIGENGPSWDGKAYTLHALDAETRGFAVVYNGGRALAFYRQQSPPPLPLGAGERVLDVVTDGPGTVVVCTERFLATSYRGQPWQHLLHLDEHRGDLLRGMTRDARTQKLLVWTKHEIMWTA